jgi:hypothetical protein
LSYYAYVEVDAEDADIAHDKAIREAWRMQERGEGVWGEEPTVYDLIEGEMQ